MKIKEILAKVNKWHTYGQIQFLEKIPELITIAVRDILLDENSSQSGKLDAIKWLNEFNHRLLTNLASIKKGNLSDEIEAISTNAKSYGKENQITKNSIYWSIQKAYERTTSQLENPTVRAREQYIIMNALNEVCTGAYAIDKEEFHTLMGVTKEDVLQLWTDLNNNWVNKYVIIKDKGDTCISHSLIKWGQPIDENNEEALFFFEAKNYTRASEIFNRFLGFEPYVPMPENVVVQRVFTLNDTNNKFIKNVELVIYQPVKNNSGEWSCSYQISEIQNNKLYSVLGVDSLQSLQLALNIIHGLLNNHNNENENQIIWLEKELELIKE